MKLNKVWLVLAMALVMAAVSVWPVGAQDGTPTVTLPGIFYNPILLAAVGIVIQFVPGVRKLIGNVVIPYITTILAWVSGLFAPEAASAAGGPIAVIAAGSMFGLGGFLGGLGGAILQSAQGYLLQRMFAWPGKILPKVPTDSKL